MNQIPPEAREMLSRNGHIREVFDKLVARLQYSQFDIADVSLVFQPEIVPDISRLTDQQDTLVAVIKMEMKPRTPENDLSEYKDLIGGIHSRYVFIAGMKPDHSFDVAYNYIKSPILTIEFFRTYRDKEEHGVETWASEVAAEKVWDFLLKGITPAHDRQIHKHGPQPE